MKIGDITGDSGVGGSTTLISISRVGTVGGMSFGREVGTCGEGPLSLMLLVLMNLTTTLSTTTLVFVVTCILIQNIPGLAPRLFSLRCGDSGMSYVPSVVGAVILALMALVVSMPFNIKTTVCLTRCTGHNGGLIGMVEAVTRALTNVPSVICNLFNVLFFICTLG